MLQELIFCLLQNNNRSLSRLIQFSKIRFIPSPDQLVVGIFAPEKYLEVFQLKFPAIVANIRVAVPFEIRLYVLGDTMVNVSIRNRKISNFMVATQERIEQTQEAIAVAAADESNSNQKIVNLSSVPRQWREAILEQVRLAQLPVLLGENGNFDLPLESFQAAWASLGNKMLLGSEEESTEKPAKQKQPKGKRLLAKVFSGEDVKGRKNGYIETLQNFLQKITSSYSKQEVLQTIVNSPDSQLGGEIFEKLKIGYLQKYKSWNDSTWNKKKSNIQEAAAQILQESTPE